MSFSLSNQSSSVAGFRNFGHLQEAIDAVELRIKGLANPTDKIKASSGLILTTKTENGDVQILMGRLNKLDRPKPNDAAGVHGFYGVFSGGVEFGDSGKDMPTVIVATIREVVEESLGALDKDAVLNILERPTTKLIKNAGWKFFNAVSFHANISAQEGQQIVENFNSKINQPENAQHEITDLAWVSLRQLIDAQIQKDAEYKTLQTSLEQARGTPFTADELRDNKELGVVYNKNLKLASGVSVAHFVARTIFGVKDDLLR